MSARPTLYQRLRRRFPPILVDLAWVAVRAALILLVILLADVPFSPFTYFRR